jgi:hypothetical protein
MGAQLDEGNDGALPMDDKVRLMIAVSAICCRRLGLNHLFRTAALQWTFDRGKSLYHRELHPFPGFTQVRAAFALHAQFGGSWPCWCVHEEIISIYTLITCELILLQSRGYLGSSLTCTRKESVTHA